MISECEAVSLMTMANGITVRITDRMKPIRYDFTLPWLAPPWEVAE
jgi:hypothetical protein